MSSDASPESALDETVFSDSALVRQICEKTLESRDEVLARVKRKRDEFSGLLSQESALKIIARESGVEVPSLPVKFEFSSLASLSLLEEAAVGLSCNVFVRVMQVFAPKEFDTGKRKGRVCNVAVADATGNANLVLWNQDVNLVEWGKFERNDFLEIIGATVKKATPLELHSSLVTQINAFKPSALVGTRGEEGVKIPENKVAERKISALSAADVEFDLYARVLRIWDEKEFTRQDGKKGRIASLLVSDGTGQARVALWDKNADVAKRVKLGDAVKVEGGYCKPDLQGKPEVHVGWKGRVVIEPSHHLLADKEKIWAELYPRKLLNEAKDGEECIILARVAQIYDGKKMLKCVKCNSTISPAATAISNTASPNAIENAASTLQAHEENASNDSAAATKPLQEALACLSCGFKESRELVVVRAELDDGTASMRTIFFGKTALDLLAINDLSLDISTVISLKKEFVLGESLLLLVMPKKNESGSLELTARHVISRNPKAEADAEFVKEKL